MGYSIYEILFFFYIYAFLGWCVEVIYATVNSGKFVNRGFLNGPVCPIYGFGVLLVIISLESLKDNLIILFLGSVILTSAIEFITGFILEKVFNDKWWDYSEVHFNIKGYICLKFSLIWGVTCILVVDVVQPIIYKFVNLVPVMLGKTVIFISMVIFLIDFIATSTAISKFKRSIRLMDELVSSIKVISDEIGINISDGVLLAMEKQENVRGNVDSIKEAIVSKVDIEKRKEELEELKEKYEMFIKKQKNSYERILKAFPDLQKGKYKNYIDKMKKYYKKISR